MSDRQKALAEKVANVGRCKSLPEKVQESGEFTLNEVSTVGGTGSEISPQARVAIMRELEGAALGIAGKYDASEAVIAGCMADLLAHILAASLDLGFQIGAFNNTGPA